MPTFSTPSKKHRLLHLLSKVCSTEHWQGRGSSSWNKCLAGGLHRKAFINMLLGKDKSLSLWLNTCFLSEWPINVLYSNRPSILKVLIAPNQGIKQVILPLFSVFLNLSFRLFTVPLFSSLNSQEHDPQKILGWKPYIAVGAEILFTFFFFIALKVHIVWEVTQTDSCLGL